LAWCPWQPKLLASGDTEGTVQLWNVNTSSPHSNAVAPGKLELGAPVTSLHFSAHCKELLSTHGMKSTTPTAANGEGPESPPTSLLAGMNSLSWPARAGVVNGIAVHAYPSLRHVTTLSAAGKPIGNSVLNSNGTKLILAILDDNKIQVCDVWTKRKELKRQPSFFNSTIR
jgi:cell division cycle protein 20 (cofactor of APC complex)